MDFKGLLQVFGRPWLIEESQALYWAEVAHQVLVSKTMDAIPGMDPRTHGGMEKAYGEQMFYRDIFRVDENANRDPKGPVQVIRLNGPLMEEDYCGSPGMETMQQVVRAAKADTNILSLVLLNNSPGGTVAGTENLSKEVKEFDKKKPALSFVNKMMCSADYWIGSSGREIICDEESGGYNSLIGSIGTKCTIMDRSAEMEAKGIKIRHVYADKSSRKGKYMDDVMAGNDERIKHEMNMINEKFIQAVMENRAGKLKLDKEDVMEGDVYNAKDAIKWGLADRFGSFSYAVKRSISLAKSIK